MKRRGRARDGPHAHLDPAVGRTPLTAPMRVVTKTAELEELSRELAAQPFVAVDTEFMRETTYWPNCA